MKKFILQGEEELQKGIFYEIDTDSVPLGVGGSGTVYRGVLHNADGSIRDVAVKFLYEGLSPTDLARARKEASIQIRNDNLLEMLGFIELTDDIGQPRYHVVSELLSGVMLHDVLNGKTENADGVSVPLAEELLNLYQRDKTSFAITVIKSVLSGIMALHDKGYIHRDIDPSNIMITTAGHIKLIDFGLAKSIIPDKTAVPLTVNGRFMGKPAYAAPELVIGDTTSLNQTTDLYAIGVLLFQLSTGHLPFDGSMVEVLKAQKEKNPPLAEVGNSSLRKVISKAMAKNQADRFQSASEFRVALDQVKYGPESDDLNGVNDNKLRWIIFVLAGLLVIGLGYLIYNHFFNKSEDSSTGPNPIVIDTSKVNVDTLMVTEDTPKVTEDTPKVSVDVPKKQPNPPAPTKGTLQLGYAVWEGSVLQGKPHGLGKMTYKEAHPIGNGETAQPGDVIEGNFRNGHWNDIPTWHKSTGETKKVYNL